MQEFDELDDPAPVALDGFLLEECPTEKRVADSGRDRRFLAW
jgi:hypothetical protein